MGTKTFTCTASSRITQGSITTSSSNGSYDGVFESAKISLYFSVGSGTLYMYNYSFNISITVDGVATGSGTISFSSDSDCRGKYLSNVSLSGASGLDWTSSSHTISVSCSNLNGTQIYYKNTQTIIVTSSTPSSGGGGGGSSSGGDSGQSTSPGASSIRLNPTTVTEGSTLTCTINAVSSGVTHVVRWYIGNIQLPETSTSITITASHISNIKYSDTASIRCSVDTMSGSTIVGNAEATVTVTVPDKYVPTISGMALYQPTPSTLFNNSKYVTGLTYPGVSVSSIAATGGAYLYSYTIVCTGLPQYMVRLSSNQTSASITYTFTNTVVKSGQNTITVIATDTRGRQTTQSISFDVYGYSTPRITSYDTYRCLSDGTADNEGEYIYITASYVLGSDIGGDNDITSIKIYTRESGFTYSLVGNYTKSSFPGSIIIPGSGSGTYLNTKTYDIKIDISDTYLDTYHPGYPVSAYDKVFPFSRNLIDLIGKPNHKAIGIGTDVQNVMDGDNFKYIDAFVVNANWEIWYKDQVLDDRFVLNTSVLGSSGSLSKIYYGQRTDIASPVDGQIVIEPIS